MLGHYSLTKVYRVNTLTRTIQNRLRIVYYNCMMHISDDNA